jgi:hypothetical protein
MPATNTSSYDRFDYRHYDEKPLALDEASRKVSEMRRKDPVAVYRIVPTDEELRGFYVDKIAPLELYAELVARLSRQWAKLLSSGSTMRR